MKSLRGTENVAANSIISLKSLWGYTNVAKWGKFSWKSPRGKENAATSSKDSLKSLRSIKNPARLLHVYQKFNLHCLTRLGYIYKTRLSPTTMHCIGFFRLRHPIFLEQDWEWLLPMLAYHSSHGQVRLVWERWIIIIAKTVRIRGTLNHSCKNWGGGSLKNHLNFFRTILYLGQK